MASTSPDPLGCARDQRRGILSCCIALRAAADVLRHGPAYDTARGLPAETTLERLARATVSAVEVARDPALSWPAPAPSAAWSGSLYEVMADALANARDAALHYVSRSGPQAGASHAATVLAADIAEAAAVIGERFVWGSSHVPR